jgi:hypothetical protein
MFDYRYLLSGSGEDVVVFENATTTNERDTGMMGSGDASEDENSTSMLVQKEIILFFNLVPIVLILIMGCMCCFCPGAFSKVDDYINSIGSQSDRGDAIVRRQIERDEKNKEDPDERRARLEEHFKKHRVKMVRNFDMFFKLRPKIKWALVFLMLLLCFNSLTMLFRLTDLDKRIVFRK